MKTPCSNCPFRSDRPFYLPADRVLGIGHALTHDGSFPCHKNHANPCIGAISVLDKQGDAMANVWVRSAARCGLVNYPIAHDVPVYSSFEEAAIVLSGNSANTAGILTAPVTGEYQISCSMSKKESK